MIRISVSAPLAAVGVRSSVSITPQSGRMLVAMRTPAIIGGVAASRRRTGFGAPVFSGSRAARNPSASTVSGQSGISALSRS